MTTKMTPREAIRTLTFLIRCTDESHGNDECAHDLRAYDTRSLLIDPDYDDFDSDCPDLLRDLTDAIRANETREEMTELALSFSLCPLHFCDYAICFDDETPECTAIRIIHPAHDS